MQNKSEDAGGLTPTKERNAVSADFSRRQACCLLLPEGTFPSETFAPEVFRQPVDVSHRFSQKSGLGFPARRKAEGAGVLGPEVRPLPAVAGKEEDLPPLPQLRQEI